MSSPAKSEQAFQTDVVKNEETREDAQTVHLAPTCIFPNLAGQTCGMLNVMTSSVIFLTTVTSAGLSEPRYDVCGSGAIDATFCRNGLYSS